MGFEWKLVCPHQEPVDVHEQQRQEKSVEEEVEGNAGDRLEAGDTCGIQYFEREPVETEPEPKTDGHRYTRDSRDTNINHVISSSVAS